MKTLIFAVSAVLCMAALTGCATVNSYKHGPHGGPLYAIHGMTVGSAYGKADEECPQGYYLISPQGQRRPLDYEITVECKTGTGGTGGTQQMTSAMRGPDHAPQPAHPRNADTMYAAAQAYATYHGCSGTLPTLRRNDTRDLYEASCPDGRSLHITCSNGSCQRMDDAQTQ